MPSRRSVRAAAVAGTLGLAGAYAFEAAQYHRAGAKGFELERPPAPGTPDFARLVEALTAAPLRQGNRVTVLRNGDEIFPAMLAAIQDAEETVDFATYVYWTGSIAPRFADAPAERARAGVEVNVLLDAVGAARERLWLTTAYFAPRRAFVEALCAAVARGVDVRVLVNGPHIDTEAVRQAGRRCYDRLLACGGRIFEYQRTMPHAEVLVVDSAWATVGSINFDNRSFALNDELNLSVRDPAKELGSALLRREL